MKALSIFLTCITIILFTGCSKDTLEDLSLNNISTRTSGDGIYDALGYGYDVTEEYMGENSTKLRIIDVAAFVRDHKDRFDNPFLGVIDQKVYAGEDVFSFLSQVSRESNFSGSVGSVGLESQKEVFFSATVSTGFKSSTLHSYSTKYSFAKAEVLKKQRRYFLNTDLNTLSKYLSTAFLEDLKKYSADKIITMYGTHILTNIIVGGKYVAYYKSIILDETDRTEKTKSVSAGAKVNLSAIGLDANGTWSKTEITEQNRKNSNWECHIKSIGGSSSGTSMTINPNQGPSYTVNLGAWTESVDDTHSRLIDVDWNATYPLYELISDPMKKTEIKNAIINYIASKQIRMLEVFPLYQFDKNGCYYYDTLTNTLNWRNNGVTCYVMRDGSFEKVFPLYQFIKNNEYYYDTQSYMSGWENQGIVCYIYKEQIYEDLVPLYQFYLNGRYHYNTQVFSSGWQNQGIVGFVFPQ